MYQEYLHCMVIYCPIPVPVCIKNIFIAWWFIAQYQCLYVPRISSLHCGLLPNTSACMYQEYLHCMVIYCPIPVPVCIKNIFIAWWFIAQYQCLYVSRISSLHGDLLPNTSACMYQEYLHCMVVYCPIPVPVCTKNIFIALWFIAQYQCLYVPRISSLHGGLLPNTSACMYQEYL